MNNPYLFKHFCHKRWQECKRIMRRVSMSLAVASGYILLMSTAHFYFFMAIARKEVISWRCSSFWVCFGLSLPSLRFATDGEAQLPVWVIKTGIFIFYGTMLQERRCQTMMVFLAIMVAIGPLFTVASWLLDFVQYLLNPNKE